jgi:hypothetical protein
MVFVFNDTIEAFRKNKKISAIGCGHVLQRDGDSLGLNVYQYQKPIHIFNLH